MTLAPRVRGLIDHWRIFAPAVIAVVSMAWIAITQADEVLRTTREVPELKREQAVIKQAQAELLLQQRLTQQQVEMLSGQMSSSNSMILQRLDRIIDAQK